MRRLLAVGLLVVAVAGCSSEDPAPAPVPVPEISSPPSTAAVLPGEQPRPNRIEIPAVGADGPIMPEGLGVDQSGGFEEPPLDSPELASWYNPGPRPGAKGPSVILGHVDGGGQFGVFARLDEVEVGDQVIVHREDGTSAAFEVTRVSQQPKANFPTQEVFGATDGSEIRLITCTGELDRSSRRHVDNFIVYARLVL